MTNKETAKQTEFGAEGAQPPHLVHVDPDAVPGDQLVMRLELLLPVLPPGCPQEVWEVGGAWPHLFRVISIESGERGGGEGAFSDSVAGRPATRQAGSMPAGRRASRCMATILCAAAHPGEVGVALDVLDENVILSCVRHAQGRGRLGRDAASPAAPAPPGSSSAPPGSSSAPRSSGLPGSRSGQWRSQRPPAAAGATRGCLCSGCRCLGQQRAPTLMPWS